jgi:hypothetical protein
MIESALNPTSSGKNKFQETMVICGGTQNFVAVELVEKTKMSVTNTYLIFV